MLVSSSSPASTLPSLNVTDASAVFEVSSPASSSTLASATPASGSDTVTPLEPVAVLVMPPVLAELVLPALDVELSELEPPPLVEVPLEPVVDAEVEALEVEALEVDALVVVLVPLFDAPVLVVPVECDVVDDEPEDRDDEALPLLVDEPPVLELELVLKSPVSEGGALELSLQPDTTMPQADATSVPATNRAIGLAPWAVSLIM